jgi:hypothetical protein
MTRAQVSYMANTFDNEREVARSRAGFVEWLVVSAALIFVAAIVWSVVS